MSRQVRGNSPFRTVRKLFFCAVAFIILIYCGTAAYHFGMEIFSGEGVEAYPGTDLTIEVAEGTSMKELGKELEEYGVVKNSTVFYVQSLIYEVKRVVPGTYTFNTSHSGDKILATVTAGPAEQQEETTTE